MKVLLFEENGVIKQVTDAQEVTRESLQESITEIDNQIAALLARKLDLTEAISKYDRLTNTDVSANPLVPEAQPEVAPAVQPLAPEVQPVEQPQPDQSPEAQLLNPLTPLQ